MAIYMTFNNRIFFYICICSNPSPRFYPSASLNFNTFLFQAGDGEPTLLDATGAEEEVEGAGEGSEAERVRAFLLGLEPDPPGGRDELERMLRSFSEEGRALVRSADENGGSGGYLEYVSRCGVVSVCVSARAPVFACVNEWCR